MNKNNYKAIIECDCVNCEELHDGKCRLGHKLIEDNCKDYSIVITTPEMYEYKVRENAKDIYEIEKNK